MKLGLSIPRTGFASEGTDELGVITDGRYALITIGLASTVEPTGRNGMPPRGETSEG